MKKERKKKGKRAGKERKNRENAKHNEIITKALLCVWISKNLSLAISSPHANEAISRKGRDMQKNKNNT